MIALHACTVFNNTGLSVRSKKEKRVMDARFITWEFFFFVECPRTGEACTSGLRACLVLMRRLQELLRGRTEP